MIEKTVFFSALLGGGISAATAAGFFLWEKSWGAKLRRIETARLQTSLIFSATTKIMAYYGIQVSIKNHLDKCFQDAEDEGHGELDPADKVLELVLQPVGSERLTSEELALCLLSRDYGLLEKLLSSQNKLFSTYYSMVKLNELLSEYRTFIAETALVESEISGNQGHLTMPANSRPKRDSMVANINSLVGDMMGYMETDIPYCRETILRFLSAVRSIEGVDVPKVKIEDDAK